MTKIQYPEGGASLQHELYERFVASHETELASSLEKVRNFVDDVMYEAQARIWYGAPATSKRDFQNKDASPLFGYPDGCCLEIVGQTMENLLDVAEDEAPYLVDFMKGGGVVKRGWWTYRSSTGKEYLQNFIQVGDRIWDVAFEEMEPEKNVRVDVSHVSEGKYRNFESLGELLAATERYYVGTKYRSSLPYLGWMAVFHAPICFQETSWYLMRAGGNHGFWIEEAIGYLESGASSEADSEIAERMSDAVTHVLAFRSEELDSASSFVLAEVSRALKNGPGELSDAVSKAKGFVKKRHADFDMDEAEFFQAFGTFVDYAMGLVSDEYYDRLREERGALGLVDADKGI